MKLSALPFLLILFLFSCTKEITTPVGTLPLFDTTIKDISYGTNTANKLDLFLPAKRTIDSKIVIFIHGGGWNSGDKSEFTFFANGLKERGFAVANINYRLSPQSKDNYNMQLDDIGQVISYLSTNSGYYTFSNQNFYITGHSAGAHLSLSYAYTRNADGKIKAAGGLSTPTNLFTGATENLGIVGATTIAPYLGAPLNAASEQRYKEASPYYHVTKSTVPTILFAGSIDFVVPPVQSISLDNELKQFGVAEKLVIYPFIFHSWWDNANLVTNTLNETAAWFNAH
ncbi:MAG: alpha/beta hydrolase [Ginsengibacter sp.]|jgi:acetyl esterase/lipase